MLKLVRFLKGHIAEAIFGPLAKLMEAAFELVVPLVVAYIINTVIPSGNTSDVFLMGGVLLALGAAGLGFSLTCQYLAARASLGFGTNLRRALYEKVNSFSLSELDTFGAPSLVTRLTNDVNQTQVGVAMFIRLVLRSPFITIGSIILAFSISPLLSIIFVAVSVLIALVLYILMSHSGKFYRTIQKSLDEVALLTRENLSGTRVVRAFSRQDEECEDFKKTSSFVAQVAKKAGKVSALINPLTFSLINLAVIAVLYFGGIKVNEGALQAGDIAALVNYLAQILLSLMVLANLVVTFTKASACARKINEVLDTPCSLTFVDESKQVKKIEGSAKIEFKNAYLKYKSAAGYALEDLSFSIADGETIGIIGSTGSGKSSVLGLLCRFYDTAEGSILIDGVNVRDYPSRQLYSQIAIVPQGASLFSGTIRSNMLMGNPKASDDEILAALKNAESLDFVLALKNGIDSPVNQGGTNFSGGQRQRLTIARALVKNPEILILDDSLSALDYATDAALRRNIKNSTHLKTVIVVSQRASSIRTADKILVLDEGKIAGFDTHDNLIKDCPIYKEICLSQGQSVESEK